MKRPHDDDDSDDESCVDLTEEPPADVKPKLPEPHVFDVDEDPVQAPIRRGLLLQSMHSGFYAARSTNKSNGRQSSRVLLVARQFTGGMGSSTLQLAESDPFVQGEARQFKLSGPAVSRRGVVARLLGLKLTIGSIDITSDDEEIAVIVGADGLVETRSGSRLRRVGELSFDEGEEGPTVSVYSTKFLAKALHPNAMDHKDPELDGSVLVEASALDFDVVAGVDESQ